MAKLLFTELSTTRRETMRIKYLESICSHACSDRDNITDEVQTSGSGRSLMTMMMMTSTAVGFVWFIGV